MKEVTLIEVVRVYDEEKLMAYADSQQDRWGMCEDLDLATAVRESVVLNQCVPLDIGIELVYSEQHVEEVTDD